MQQCDYAGHSLLLKCLLLLPCFSCVHLFLVLRDWCWWWRGFWWLWDGWAMLNPLLLQLLTPGLLISPTKQLHLLVLLIFAPCFWACHVHGKHFTVLSPLFTVLVVVLRGSAAEGAKCAPISFALTPLCCFCCCLWCCLCCCCSCWWRCSRCCSWWCRRGCLHLRCSSWGNNCSCYCLCC